MDSIFEELVAVDSEHPNQVFSGESEGNHGDRENLRDDVALHVRSILAHYSQTSRSDTMPLPSMANLSEVFDSFLLQTARLHSFRDFGVWLI